MSKLLNRIKISRGKIRIFPILFIIFSLTLSVMAADFFSNVISTGNFVFSVNTSAKSTGFEVYSISLYKTINKAQSESLAENVKLKGGAGYIWQINLDYHVLASCYLEQNDAQKVMDTLNNSGTSCEIIKITFKNITISSSTLSADEKIVLNNCVNIFKNTYKLLYDISVAYDTKVSKYQECLIAINGVVSEVENTRQIFDSNFKNKLTNNLIYIKLKIAECKNIIEDLSSKIDESEKFSTNIKYSYFCVLKLYDDLYKDINDEL